MRYRHIAACLVLLVTAPARAEIFVDAGVTSTQVDSLIANREDSIRSTDTGAHLGVGARRRFGESNDIGVRLELERVGSDLFLAVRALDLRHHFSERIAAGVFAGAARLDLATPAYGWYLGAGIDVKDVLPRFDLGIDVYLGDEVARDNLLPSDPSAELRPDNFHDVTGLRVYLSRRF